ncbi:unnamed protein product [Closterium sp. NIES-54]
MHFSFNAKGDCYWCVPPDPGIAAAALGASASGTPPGSAPAEALHTFMLDSMNLVSTVALQDAMVTTTTPGGQRVSICTCTRTGRHLATFTRRPGSSLYTLATKPPQVAASAQVSASGQVAASCSCRLLSHQTLFLAPPPWSPLPTTPSWHALPSPCLWSPQCAAPHSSLFPPTTAPLQTLDMDVWGPARVSGQGRERYFLLVVEDYTRYTTVFPLRSKGEVSAVLIPWIRTVRLQLRERFGQDLPVLCLHSDRAPHWLSHGGRSYLHDSCGRSPFSVVVCDKLSARTIPCVFLGFVPDAPSWQFYHPTLRRVLPSQDVTFNELVPFYRLFPYRSAPSPPSPLFLAPGPPPPGGTGSEGAGSRGAEPEGVEPGGAESEGTEPGGAESEGAESGGAASSGGHAGASPRQSSQQLPGAGGAGAGVAGVGGPGAGGAGAAGARAVDPGTGGAGGTVRPRSYFFPLLQQVLGVPSSTGLPPPFLCPQPDQSQPPLQPASSLPVPSPYTEQSGGLTERREPASRPVSPVRTAHLTPHSHPPPVPGTHIMALRPSSVPLRVPLPAPPESSLHEVPDPESDRAPAASPTVARLLATAVTDPSFESAAASALVAELLDLAAACRLDYASALFAESVPASPPSIGGECALSTDVLDDRQEDFECLATAVPRFASLLLAPEGDPDAPDIPTPRSYAEAITGPYSSQWQAAMDAEMASWKSTGTFVDEVPPLGVNIADGMWIFRVKRSPGSPPAFKARYVARGFSQRHGVDYFQTFSPTPKMTTLWVLLHVAAQRDYEFHSLDFSTAFPQGSLHEEIWLRRPPGFTGSFPTGTQTTLAALGFVPSTADPSLFLHTDTSLPPFYVLVYVDDLVFATADTEALTLVLQRFGFQYSSPQLTPLSTSHSLSAPPLDESVEPSGPYPELVVCLMHRKVQWDAAKRVLRYQCSTSGMGLVLGGRGPVVLSGHADASWVDDLATQRSSQGYTFSLGSGSVSWRSTRSFSVLSSSCEAEIYAGAMAAQELR